MKPSFEVLIIISIVHYVNTGDTVQLPCNVSSHPQPVSYQWTLKRPGHFRDLTSNSSVLMYSAWSTTDYGILQCKSVNAAGKQQEPCTFVIKPTGNYPKNTRLKGSRDQCDRKLERSRPSNTSISLPLLALRALPSYYM